MNPTGMVTFLFTDIVGSTKIAQDLDGDMHEVLKKHNLILRNAVESNGGFVFNIIGDAFCCAFENAADSVKAAVEANKKLSEEEWNNVDVKIRMGIHSGSAEWNGTDYVGYITLSRTSRIMSSAHGEQIVVSNDVYESYVNCIEDTPGKTISFRDLGERRLKDVIQPVRLFQIISPGLRVDFPPLKTLDARPNNLPVQLTSFIGREEVMRHIKNLLSQTHLLTIVGPGGGGKTRLALQTGADIIDDFENGVFISELAPITDSNLIVQTVMNSLGAKEDKGITLSESLSSYLKDKEMLIILDNCEHLISECAKLSEILLRSCPKLKIIATSREALKCPGEQTFNIPSLEIPESNKQIKPENLLSYESASLFNERALAVNPGFHINPDNAQSLADICRRLDGIPLAIELAAVRTKILSVEQICSRLDDRFRLLTGGARTSLPRQQTLKALIDWSYDLLNEKEKILWSRLSAFAGGFTLDAAEEICSDEKLTRDEILELLSHLTEKSIVIFDSSNNRFRILETLKQYGITKLNESKEENKIHSNHFQYFLKFSESARPELTGNNAQQWFDKIEIDHTNIQSAIQYAIDTNQQEQGIELVVNLGKFWNSRGHFSATSKFLSALLEDDKLVSKPAIINALIESGSVAVAQGEFEKAKDFYERSLEYSKQEGNKKKLASSVHGLGSVAWNLGNYSESLKFYEENLAYVRDVGDKDYICLALYNMGIVAYYLGRYEESRKYFGENLSLSRETGNKLSIANALNGLGNLENVVSNFEKALEYTKESLQLAIESGSNKSIAHTHNNLGMCLSNLGNYPEAKKNFLESLAIYRELNMKVHIASCLGNLGDVACNLNELDESIEFSKESNKISHETGSKRIITTSLLNLGKVSLKQGSPDLAEEYFNESLDYSRELDDKLCIAEALSVMAFIQIEKENLKQAKIFYMESLNLGVEMNRNNIILENMIGLSFILLDEKDFRKSLLLAGAVEEFVNSNDLNPDENVFKLMGKIKEEIANDKEMMKLFEEGKEITLKEAFSMINN